MARLEDDGERRPLLVGTPPELGEAEERRPLLGGTPREPVGVLAVLAVQALERAAFLGIAATLPLYLTGGTFGWGVCQASRVSFLFLGASRLLSPVGGWVADVYVGCQGTLVLSFSLYLLVASLLPVSATPDGRLSLCGRVPAASGQNSSRPCQGQPPQLYCAPTVYTGLLLLALCASSVGANLAPFGAHQVRDGGGDATRRFFNWFCWSTNLGVIFSLLLVALVQQNVGFLAGYLIPVACLALALLIFLLAAPTFLTKPPTGSQVSAMIKLALKNCGCAWLAGTRTRSQWEAEDPLPNSRAQPGAPSLQEDLTNFQVLTWILPVLLTFIPYWMVYLQMQSTYYLQGLHLSIPSTFQHGQDHASTLQGYMFPGAWLPLANAVLLLALVPLKDLIIDPFLARHKLLPSPLKQMTLGMFFGLTSLLTAGLLEGQRLRHVGQDPTLPRVLGESHHGAATVPSWWQVPQFLLLGIGEIFTSIPSLEFVYAEAPKAMKGATMGLFIFLSGVGSLLGSGLWTLLSLPTHGWLSCPQGYGSIHGCHMDNYFFLLAGIQSITCLLFVWVSSSYHSPPQQLGAPQLCTGPGED